MSKPASGAFIQPVLDEAAVRQAPQRVRVYRAIRTAIAGGALAPGDRLPSARQLAADWGLARGAVDEAFAQLQMEGLIRRRVGDGTYVEPAAASATGAGGRHPVPPPREPSDLAHHVLAQAARMGVAGASRSARWARSSPADQSTPSTPPDGSAPVRLECAFVPQRASALSTTSLSVCERNQQPSASSSLRSSRKL